MIGGVCPYLGSRRDNSAYHLFPSGNNRCFAKEKTTKVYGFFKKTAPCVRVEIDQQKTICYDCFEDCPEFKEKRKSTIPNYKVGP